MSSEKLYKYTTLDSAKKIFKNKSFRFSSPCAFNDPYDLHMGSIYGYEKLQFAEDYVELFVDKTNEIKKAKTLPKDVIELRGIVDKLGAHAGGKDRFAEELITSGNAFKQQEIEYHDILKPTFNSCAIFLLEFKAR